MTEDSAQQNIQQLLRHLGATENYAGFFPTVYAVQLSMDNPERLRLITKLVYLDVAWRYSTTWKVVERNMRTLISVIWRNNPLLLSELAGFHLDHKPNNASFLAIVSGACIEHS